MKSYMKNLGFLGYPFHCVTLDGKVYSLHSNRYLTTHKCQKGYLEITLQFKQLSKSFKVHRLVAMSFIEGDWGKEVNHKDGNKENNHYTNLEWTTSLESIEHAVANGLRDVHRKLTEDDVHNICKLLQEGFKNTEVSEMTGFSKSHISGIKTGRYHSAISELYELSFVKKKDRISLDKVVDVCEGIQAGRKDYQLSKELNLNHRTIGMIRKRIIYSNVSINYKW